MNYMLNGKVMIIPSLSYDKDTVWKWVKVFLNHLHVSGKIKVESQEQQVLIHLI